MQHSALAPGLRELKQINSAMYWINFIVMIYCIMSMTLRKTSTLADIAIDNGSDHKYIALNHLKCCMHMLIIGQVNNLLTQSCKFTYYDDIVTNLLCTLILQAAVFY